MSLLSPECIHSVFPESDLIGTGKFPHNREMHTSQHGTELAYITFICISIDMQMKVMYAKKRVFIELRLFILSLKFPAIEDKVYVNLSLGLGNFHPTEKCPPHSTAQHSTRINYFHRHNYINRVFFRVANSSCPGNFRA